MYFLLIINKLLISTQRVWPGPRSPGWILIKSIHHGRNIHSAQSNVCTQAHTAKQLKFDYLQPSQLFLWHSGCCVFTTRLCEVKKKKKKDFSVFIVQFCVFIAATDGTSLKEALSSSRLHKQINFYYSFACLLTSCLIDILILCWLYENIAQGDCSEIKDNYSEGCRYIVYFKIWHTFKVYPYMLVKIPSKT